MIAHAPPAGSHPPPPPPLPDPFDLPITGMSAICNHTRTIVTHLRHSTPRDSPSPLATLIYHRPDTREPAFWLHPRMLNLPFTADAHSCCPLHVSALVASWVWFAWLVSRPPGGDLDALEGPITADVVPDAPLSSRSPAHVQLQGTDVVRVPALTDLRAVDNQGWNAMHYAVLGDTIEYARWFAAGNAWDKYWPRFLAAVFNHHEHVARDLCAAREATADMSPLDMAVAVGADQAVMYLLERELVPTVDVDLAGRTPLHHVRHEAVIILLAAVHPVKTRRWMKVLDRAGMPAWVYALRLAAGNEVLNIIIAYLDVIYQYDDGLWLPGLEHERVREVATVSVQERVALGELSEREAKLILSWVNREVVGIGEDDEWALATCGDMSNEDFQHDAMHDSDAELPPPPPYEPPAPPPTAIARPSSSASASSSSASTRGASTSINPNNHVRVYQSHAPCPFPTCQYASTPLHCDRLSTHLAREHSQPLSPSPLGARTGKYQCTFPRCSKLVRRPYDLKRHVVVHAPPDLFACVYDPGRCTFKHSTRQGVRLHLRTAHAASVLGKGTGILGKAGKSVEQDQDRSESSEGDEEENEEEDEWEVWEEGMSALGLAPTASSSSSSSSQRQVARKSMGGVRRQGSHPQVPRGVTPVKIEVEVPLLVSPPLVRPASASASAPTVSEPMKPAQCERNAPVAPVPGSKESVVAQSPRTQSAAPGRTHAPPSTAATTPLASTISDTRTRHAAPTQPQPSTALSRVAGDKDDLSSAADSDDSDDDDILDVTPMHLQARRAPPPQPPLAWPSYLTTPTASQPSTSAESNLVVISDSDDDMADVVDEPAQHLLLAQHAVDATHALFPLALPSSPSTTFTQVFATPSESSTFWAAALKVIHDTPALHPSIARQYLPPGYTGPVPRLYMHRASGRPFISFSLPSAPRLTGHMLIPVPSVGKHIEETVARAIGACALPADLHAPLAQATRKYYVDRVRRPVEVLGAASGQGVYFVVEKKEVSVRADELVGRGRPVGVQVPPIVAVAVAEGGEERRALVVVVRRKELDGVLLGIGYVKPGEEHAAVKDQVVAVWY